MQANLVVYAFRPIRANLALLPAFQVVTDATDYPSEEAPPSGDGGFWIDPETGGLFVDPETGGLFVIP